MCDRLDDLVERLTGSARGRRPPAKFGDHRVRVASSTVERPVDDPAGDQGGGDHREDHRRRTHKGRDTAVAPDRRRDDRDDDAVDTQRDDQQRAGQDGSPDDDVHVEGPPLQDRHDDQELRRQRLHEDQRGSEVAREAHDHDRGDDSRDLQQGGPPVLTTPDVSAAHPADGGDGDREEKDQEAEGEQRVGDGLGDLSERLDTDGIVDSGEGPLEVIGRCDDHAWTDERDEHRHTAENGEQPHRPPMPSAPDVTIREDDESDSEQRRGRLPHPREHPQRARRTGPTPHE